MQALIRQQLAQHLPAQRDFLIGLSGGVDSVVLLHLLIQLPELNLRAVHIHHGLSPNADHWLAFCQALCQNYKVPFVSQRVALQSTANVEANARTLRYQAISQIIRPTEVLITAHHLDDQVETFFLALKRGSGVKGLGAMQAVGKLQNFTLFRPLLGIEKADIIAYAEREQLNWIVDESNSDNRFERNFLRNRILPECRERWPQFSQMVARSAQHCADQQALIEELLSEELSRRLGAKQQLNISGFEAFSDLKQRQLIRLWLAHCGVPMPTSAQLQAVIAELIFAKADSTPEVVLGEKCVRRFRQTLFLLEKSVPIPQPEKLHIPAELGKWQLSSTFSLERTAQGLICNIAEQIHRLCLPSELCDQPLTLTFGHQGKVQEYGKAHREEMKKIWQRLGVPTWERQTTPLLFWQEQLLAVLL